MQKIEFEIITLKWVKAAYKDFPTGAGIYQVYGTSPLYGIDTLLYIGQAKNLRTRISNHFDFEDGVLGRQPNKSCRYAILDDQSLLNVVEETLIIMHKPSFNSARLLQVSSIVKAKPYYIQNHGDRGMLNMENTNYYFLNQISDKNKPSEVILPDNIL